MNKLMLSLVAIGLMSFNLQDSWAKTTEAPSVSKDKEEKDEEEELDLTEAISKQEARALKDADTLMREQMLTWSRQLGVTCNYCHSTNNFKAADKANFKTAKEHARMLKMLNEMYFSEVDSSGKQKIEANCYVCHRGQGKAKWVEPVNNLTR